MHSTYVSVHDNHWFENALSISHIEYCWDVKMNVNIVSDLLEEIIKITKLFVPLYEVASLLHDNLIQHVKIKIFVKK